MARERGEGGKKEGGREGGGGGQRGGGREERGDEGGSKEGRWFFTLCFLCRARKVTLVYLDSR